MTHVFSDLGVHGWEERRGVYLGDDGGVRRLAMWRSSGGDREEEEGERGTDGPPRRRLDSGELTG